MYITGHTTVRNHSHEDLDRNHGVLNGAVLLEAKGPTEDAAQKAGAKEGFGEWLDDCVSEDGLWEETTISCQHTHRMQHINEGRTLKSWSHVNTGQYTMDACRK